MNRCYFECGRRLQNKFDLKEAKDWDWFTGYADRTVHVCSACQTTHKEDIAALRELVGRQPEDYPRNKVHVPPLRDTVIPNPKT
jgi:hypothetical protein